MKGKRPSIRTATNKDTAFRLKAKNVHGDKYDYSQSVYTKDHEKIKIRCPAHGFFYQYVTNHLRGFGCDKCANEEKRRGFKKEPWIRACGKKKVNLVFLYVLHCYDDSEQFVKVGITKNKITSRFSGENMPYEYDIVAIIGSQPPIIYDLEQRLKLQLKDFKYRPQRLKAGVTECYFAYCKDLILKSIA